MKNLKLTKQESELLNDVFTIVGHPVFLLKARISS